MAHTRTLCLVFTTGVLFAGCSGNKSGGAAPAVQGTTAAGVTSAQQSATSSLGQPTATGQRSATSSHHTGTGDTDPPLVQLTSPRRGLTTTLNVIAVEGTITDATGVAFFLINHDPVIVGPGGQFSHLVPLSSGLNTIEIQAADPLANITRSVVPVLSGQFAPEGRPVADALAVRLNRPAFDAIERVAAQQLGGVNLAQQIMAQNPLFSGGGFGASVEVNARGASFGTPLLDLDPQAGGLRVTTELPNIDITTQASGRIIGIPYSVTVNVTVDKATVRTTAEVDVRQGGTVVTTLRNTQVDLDNFRFDIRRVPAFLERLARNAVRRLIEREIVKQVESIIPREINKLIAGANGPITQTVMGQQITLHMIPTSVVFDPDGAAVLTAGDVSLPTVAGLPTTPGSLVTPGAAPVLGTRPAVLLSANDDFLNRIGHAAWRGGLMNFTVDQTVVQQLRLPAFLQLDAFLLQIFFPSLNGLVNPADPIEIELSAGMPAIFATLPQPDLLQASMGDLTVSIYVAPAGQPRQLVLRVGTQVQMGVGVTVSAGNVIQLSVNGRPSIQSDVFETPLAPLNDLAVENLLDFVLPPVLQLLPRAWSGFPLPTHPAIQLRNLDLHRDGPGQDFLTLEGDI